MISLKDIPILVGLASTAIGGGVYVNDLRRDVAELGKAFQQHQVEQSLMNTSDRLYDTQERIKENPHDEKLKREERELNERKQRLQKQLEKIEGVPQ